MRLILHRFCQFRLNRFLGINAPAHTEWFNVVTVEPKTSQVQFTRANVVMFHAMIENNNSKLFFLTSPRYVEIFANWPISGLCVRVDSGATRIVYHATTFLGQDRFLCACLSDTEEEVLLKIKLETVMKAGLWSAPEVFFLLQMLKEPFQLGLDKFVLAEDFPLLIRLIRSQSVCLVLDTEGDPALPTSVTDWTMCEYPLMHGIGILQGSSLQSLRAATLSMEGCVILVKGAGRERQILQGFGIEPLTWCDKTRSFRGLLDIDELLRPYWASEPTVGHSGYKVHRSVNGVLNCLQALEKVMVGETSSYVWSELGDSRTLMDYSNKSQFHLFPKLRLFSHRSWPITFQLLAKSYAPSRGKMGKFTFNYRVACRSSEGWEVKDRWSYLKKNWFSHFIQVENGEDYRHFTAVSPVCPDLFLSASPIVERFPSFINCPTSLLMGGKVLETTVVAKTFVNYEMGLNNGELRVFYGHDGCVLHSQVYGNSLTLFLLPDGNPSPLNFHVVCKDGVPLLTATLVSFCNPIQGVLLLKVPDVKQPFDLLQFKRNLALSNYGVHEKMSQSFLEGLARSPFIDFKFYRV